MKENVSGCFFLNTVYIGLHNTAHLTVYTSVWRVSVWNEWTVYCVVFGKLSVCLSVAGVCVLTFCVLSCWQLSVGDCSPSPVA